MQFGLDLPLPQQFVRYVSDVVSRQDGHQPVHAASGRGRSRGRGCRRRSSWRSSAIIVAVADRRAARRGGGAATATRVLDHAVRVVTIAGLAMAAFWLAILLQLLF